MSKVLEQVVAAHKRGVPLVSVNTADPQAFAEALEQAIEGAHVRWDCHGGIGPVNKAGAQAIATAGITEDELLASANPSEATRLFAKLPNETVIHFHNPQFAMPSTGAIQGLCNLRDPFKSARSMVVMMGPGLDLPSALVRDVIGLEEPLPDDVQLAKILGELYQSAEMKPPAKDISEKAVDAVRGLSAFGAEQVLAMSMRKSGLDATAAWERKRVQVNQQKGMKLTIDGPSFKDMGGLASIVRFFELLAKGPGAPRIVLRLDEIEKMLGGLGSGGGAADNTGITQDMLGVLLREMEDNGWGGTIFVGPPGSGKTWLTRALGPEFGVPTVEADLGAMKGSLVGESETAMRDFMRTVKGLGGDRVFVVATCNKLDVLPPELRRRFKYGIWYFSLPTRAEKDAIWTMNEAKFGVEGKRPNDDKWTGAEIRNVCEIAWRLSIPLTDAAAYIVPVSKADPQSIERLESLADGRFLSASAPGVYTKGQEAPAVPRRAMADLR